jgi:hypothetical protein
MIAPDENESTNLADIGRYVPVRLKKIVQHVISHPKSSKEFKVKVDDLMLRYLKHVRREDSHILI